MEYELYVHCIMIDYLIDSILVTLKYQDHIFCLLIIYNMPKEELHSYGFGQ